VDETVFRDGGEIIEVMGNDGTPIKTNEAWYQCIRGYEVDLAEYKGTCINCTEGGALIAGARVMPFKEAIVAYLGNVFNR
jgi:hypothetical protein